MFCLVHQKLLLVGNSESDSIAELAQKKAAKILVISDSHGNRNFFKAAVRNISEKCDALVFCGDGSGDLFFCFEECLHDKDLAEAMPPVIAYVAGNGDSDIFPMLINDEYKDIIVPSEQTLVVCGKKIFITHGHRFGAYYGTDGLCDAAKARGASCVFYGHTHIPNEAHKDGVYFFNPGSITFPRAGFPQSCAVVSVGENFMSAVFYKIQMGGTKMSFVPFVPKGHAHCL